MALFFITPAFAKLVFLQGFNLEKISPMKNISRTEDTEILAERWIQICLDQIQSQYNKDKEDKNEKPRSLQNRRLPNR